ncbi:MAG: hypothetical protein NZ957_05690 [Thaumarchaeota archaeon]|nr:hypothetical protein [Candidatus Calditenuaceae archaeon]MDW8041468.1 hypothetical protein [Nitrososphaerota archaeon]
MPAYRNAGVDLEALQRNLAELLQRSGWKVNKHIPGQRSFLFEVSRGMLRKGTVKVGGTPDEVRVEVTGPDELKDLLDHALAESSSNPSAIIGWRQLEAQESLQALSSTPFGKMLGIPVPPTTAPQPAPQQATVHQQPRPAQRPKLEACLHCGAPLTYNPEEVLVICEYCGYANNPTGEAPPRMSMVPATLSGSQALTIAKDYAAKGILVTKGMVEKAVWGEIWTAYVPIWVVPVRVYGDVVGERALFKTKSETKRMAQELGLELLGAALGGRTGKTLADRERKESVDETINVPLVARRSASYQPDPEAFRVPLERKMPFRRTGDDVLNAEIGAAEAVEAAKGVALETVRARYTTLKRFNVSAYEAGDPELVYDPWWFVKYGMSGREFMVVVSGSTGTVIAGQRPWIPRRSSGGGRVA